MPLATTTKLEAINSMMTAIGESPVNTITQATTTDVSIALSILENVSREIQSQGWFFNTDLKYTLNPNTSNQIELPVNALRLNTVDLSKLYNLVERNRKLYDRKNNTYTITYPVTVDIIFYLGFEELPEVARRYITLRAARIFQDRMLGSNQLHGYHQQDEFTALMDLKEAEGDIGGHNIFNNYDAFAPLDRKNYQPSEN
jgi:hypothetical protein